MFCSKCGTEVQDEMMFCPKCGTQLATVAENPTSDNSAEEVQESKGMGGPITEDAVRRYASIMKPTKNVIVFSSGGKVHGLKLAEGEIPLILFGVNSLIGKLSMFGWCGVLFTNQAIHYKIQKASSAMLKVVKGVVKYELIRSLGLVGCDGNDPSAYLLKINDQTIAQYVTGIDDSFPVSDADSAIALKRFCDAMTPAPIGTLKGEAVISANANHENHLPTFMICLGWILILVGTGDFLLGNLGIVDLTGSPWSPCVFCGIGAGLGWRGRQLRSINKAI